MAQLFFFNVIGSLTCRPVVILINQHTVSVLHQLMFFATTEAGGHNAVTGGYHRRHIQCDAAILMCYIERVGVIQFH